MKHLLLLIFSLVVTFTMRAQSYYPDFTNNLNGVPINYKIIDQTNRYVKILGANTNDKYNSPELTFPQIVYKQGESEPYTVTEIEGGAINYWRTFNYNIASKFREIRRLCFCTRF